MALTGTSSLGMRLGWQIGDSTTVPTSGSFTWLTRVNNIGEISLDTNTIDSSALEDYEDKFIAGRAGTPGNIPITINATPDTMDEWAAVFAASAANNGVWMQEWSPQDPTQSAFYFVQTPQKFPKPAGEQNSLRTVEIQCAVVNYAGYAPAVDAPSV